jgi:feruloyl-CoA synthase
VVSQGAPYVLDAVVTGMDRDAIGLLVFPRMEHCVPLSGLAQGTDAAQVLASAPVRAHFQRLLDALNVVATGSSTRIDRMLLLSEPPSVNAGEITDKGSINQANVLTRRAALVESLYQGKDERTIIAA